LALPALPFLSPTRRMKVLYHISAYDYKCFNRIFIKKSKNNRGQFICPQLFLKLMYSRVKLFLFGSAYRAYSGAVAAADAGIGINNVLIVTLSDSAYRAFACTRTALNACVSNLESHIMYPP